MRLWCHTHRAARSLFQALPRAAAALEKQFLVSPSASCGKARAQIGSSSLQPQMPGICCPSHRPRHLRLRRERAPRCSADFWRSVNFQAAWLPFLAQRFVGFVSSPFFPLPQPTVHPRHFSELTWTSLAPAIVAAFAITRECGIWGDGNVSCSLSREQWMSPHPGR